MINRIGMIFGRLKVIAFSHKASNSTFWICRCKCQNIKIVSWSNLKRTSSCGCLLRETSSTIRRTHGESHNAATKEYTVWIGIKSRCFRKKDKRYNNYGGRGITMHPEWVASYQSFLDYVGRAPSNLHSIDRINNDGNYEPGNVRWATRIEQANNKSNNKPIIDIETGIIYDTIMDAIRSCRYGTDYQMLYRQLSKNKSTLIYL